VQAGTAAQNWMLGRRTAYRKWWSWLLLLLEITACFCFVLRLFGGLYIPHLVSSVGEEGLSVVQYQAGAHQLSEWPNPF
jgi:hypothetical protein